MNRTKILFWVTTFLGLILHAYSAVVYFTQPDMRAVMTTHFGYPAYFPFALGTAKVLGIVAIVLPMVPRWLKEWAYAGFIFDILFASLAHYMAGDGIGPSLFPLVIGGFILASRYFYLKLSAI